MILNVHNELSSIGVLAGLVSASAVSVGESAPALLQELRDLVAQRSKEEFPPARVKEGVRALLRRGGFKPSGRNKPASEYLAQAAREGRFPFINNLVDINNLISLESGLPVSLLDGDVCAGALSIRLGRAGESYVFNQAGQEIALEGLICVCADGKPLGNPVKDSLLAKVKADTSKALGVVYACALETERAGLEALLVRFAGLLEKYGAACGLEIQLSA